MTDAAVTFTKNCLMLKHSVQSGSLNLLISLIGLQFGIMISYSGRKGTVMSRDDKHYMECSCCATCSVGVWAQARVVWVSGYKHV
jgi:hypothetical protein